MSNTDIEIVVDDPTAPETDSPAVVSTGVKVTGKVIEKTVDVVTPGSTPASN